MRRTIVALAFALALAVPSAAHAAGTITYSGGVYTFTGTGSPDVLFVLRGGFGDGSALNQVVFSDGSDAQTLTLGTGAAPRCGTTRDGYACDTTGTTGVTVNGLEGNDRVSAHTRPNGEASPLTLPVTLNGGAGDDVLEGGNNEDSLFGNAGADVLDGRGDGDLLDGNSNVQGTGDDTASYASAPSGVSVSVGGATGAATGGGGGDTLRGIVDVVGSSFADIITGNDAGNELRGGGGNDIMNGQQGADVVLGEAGDDGLTGNRGTDTVRGGDGDDLVAGGANTVVERDVVDGGDGTDVADFFGDEVFNGGVGVTANLATGDNSSGDTYTDIEGLRGTRRDDVLTGTDGPNRIEANEGADRVSALGGDDVVDAGVGSDTVDGGPGRDRVEHLLGTRAAAGVTIDLAATGKVQGGAEDGAAGARDELTGLEDVTGSAGDDTLKGDGGANALAGGIGNDTLTGDGGADVLLGGIGSDRLEARDALTDTRLECGEPAPRTLTPDDDVAVVDFGDPDVPDCETVDRAAAPTNPGSGTGTGTTGTTGGTGTGGAGTGGSGTTPPPALKAARLSLAGKVVRTARGRRIVARATFTGSCSGTVRITTKAGKAAAKRSTAVLKRSRGACRFTVRLPRRGRVAITATLRKTGYAAATAKRTVR